ncbi:type II toxin-antitoxin system RelE/ParE family toxin [Campylobacter gastrosuis]|uniref:Type II toxin-antitoxin system RelE/ParE family toxin n=1 Tax=Campylobacter gastrosuis TaxID=2974576 RepID=A0ABT7HQD8_9BACT|nr:type II toxin-antitoxin system RelE/ParE family toxin [Campylobacter gastrosuis]MDL0088833.1 type II toxin-antitoxin system RelE/ParE family toxin [Campylobacter gastrosuis]
MKIIYSERFQEEIGEIFNFIAKDSIERAIIFYNELIIKTQKIKDMPYSFRKNLDINNKNVRDLIFKGYVIPYHINNETSTITILFIYKENQPKIDFKE